MHFRLPTLVLGFLFLSVIISSSQCAHLFPREQFFCGTKLVHTLSKMCQTYNSSADVGRNGVRQKGIIETCCKKPCSDYVLASYCGTLKQTENGDNNTRKRVELVSPKTNFQ